MENIRKALNKTSQMMQKLTQAGMTEELMNSIINSPDNQMAKTMVSSISDKVKNKFLTEIHNDKKAITLKTYGPNVCFEELFGSLCGHNMGEDTIHTLTEKLKENNLSFSSKKAGFDYIKSGVKSEIHKKRFNYYFTYLDEDGKILIAEVAVYTDGYVHVSRHGFWFDRVCYASYAHRIVVPATKNLETKS